VYASTYSESGANGFLPTGIYAFAAGAGLSPVPGSPFSPTVSGPIAFSRDSKFLYTADGTGALSVLAAFSIASDGSLSPVPGSPFTIPAALTILVANPTSDFLYGLADTGDLLVFAIDSASGSATLLSSVVAYAEAATVTPNGRYLYLVKGQEGGSQLLGFAVDSNTGALSALPGPLTTAVMQPGSVVIDAAGKFLYLADTLSIQTIHACCVTGFAIDANTGALTQLPNSPFNLGGAVSALAASGGFLLAVIAPSGASACTLSVISVDPAVGTLDSVPGSPVGQLCGSLAVDSSLPDVYDGVGYESGSGGTILAFYLDHTGALTQIEAAPVPAPTMGMVAVVH
jgi:6-phosphogluconolactonase (cycloisomerase 2 family)